MKQGTLPVYLYTIEGEFIQIFPTTLDCAYYFDKDSEYINHSLCYNAKIRKNGKWYVISRYELEPTHQKFNRSKLLDNRSKQRV